MTTPAGVFLLLLAALGFLPGCHSHPRKFVIPEDRWPSVSVLQRLEPDKYAPSHPLSGIDRFEFNWAVMAAEPDATRQTKTVASARPPRLGESLAIARSLGVGKGVEVHFGSAVRFTFHGHQPEDTWVIEPSTSNLIVIALPRGTDYRGWSGGFAGRFNAATQQWELLGIIAGTFDLGTPTPGWTDPGYDVIFMTREPPMHLT
jgi:hypothetical protein